VSPLALTAVSVALYALAFPPVGCAPLAWVALAPLLVAVARSRPRRAAALGLAWGAGIAGAVGWALPGMVVRWFGVPVWAGGAALLVVGVATAGVPVSLATGWIAWAARRGAAGPLGVAVVWGGMELLRGRVLGDPWALVAYSQLAHEHLVQLADAAGPYGVALPVVAVNALVASRFAPALAGRRPGRGVAAVAVLVVAAWTYGAWRLATPFAGGERVPVALVQPGTADADVGTWLALTREAARARPALVVWSENAVAGALDETPALRARVAEAAAGADVVVGGPSWAWQVDGVRPRNSVFLLRDGRVAGRYDKRRLLPLAEWSPVARAEAAYEPGRHARTLRSVAGRIGTVVCFEAMYPELVRGLAAGGAELLANVANDAWFGHAAAAEQHLAMARLRAVENRRWLLRAAKTGVSAVVDPWGRVVGRAPFGAAGVVSAPVAASRVRTPYQRAGDAPLVAALLAVVLAALRATAKGET
jgi:apolipoprotein N-acyltransferase